ncbi:MAG: hypothetical protein HY319_06605 [Armatimonadetes bacterium]|nr:hypothetical protein [Armatimonadota bacterium]
MIELEPGDFYSEGGRMVLTERFLLRRGYCCGSGCRHCPYGHEAVPEKIRSRLEPPRPYFEGSER